MAQVDLLRAARAGARGEVSWRSGGRVQVRSAAPAVVDGVVVLALPIDADVGDLASSAWLSVTDRRGSAGTWTSAAGVVEVTATVDLTGEWVSTPVHAQVCAKDPYLEDDLGSPLRRRERWWQVPRRLVHLRPRGASRALADRGSDHVGLVLDAGGRPLGVLAVADLAADRLAVGPDEVPAGVAHVVATAGAAPVGVPDVLVLDVCAEDEHLAVIARHGGLPTRRDHSMLGRWQAQRRAAGRARAAINVLERNPGGRPGGDRPG